MAEPAISFARIDPRDDPDQYPIHEEDDVPETVTHRDIALYLHDALSVHVPDGWVSGNVCCYWIRGDWQTYLAPDLFLVGGERPAPGPRVYLAWVHSEMRLAVEIGSKSTLQRDEGPRLDRYAEGLRPREYLYFNPEDGRVQLHRRSGEDYAPVQPDARGWVWSEEAQAWFGAEESGWLRAYDGEGVPIRSHLEEVAFAEAEAARRVEAEQRAQLAEQRIAQLEAELARLRDSG